MRKRIAIYGLSIETERHIPDLAMEYDIIGLLDSYETEGKMYGYPITTITDAVSNHIDQIIVIARPGSCKAIAKRIGDICRESKIELVDIRGKDLLRINKATYHYEQIEGYTKKELITRIQKADAVSFDLFDTLVMRQILSPNDVIELLDEKLQVEGIIITDFVTKRLSAEKRLSQGYAPKLQEIYEKIADENEISSEELAIRELELDRHLLVPRNDVVGLIGYAKSEGKKVFITSDSYYTKNQIIDILRDNGIVGYDDVIVSCEYGTSKQAGLFAKLKELADADHIIHIGDDIVSDVESGVRNGLETFHIYSGIELYEATGELGLGECINSISDRIKVGMTLARTFNSPFQFENKEKDICINREKDIGYVFFAPMICDFVQWLQSQLKEHCCNNVLFCARDGYLIQKVYELLYQDQPSTYFLTSRTAAIRAGIENERDIISVQSMKYFGDIAANLSKRFGINVTKIADSDIDKTASGLLRYKKSILSVADNKRKNNKKYISTLKLQSGKTVFFDFVAKGTCQNYMQRLLNNQLLGLYFLQLEPDYAQKEGIEIIPFYTEEERVNSVIFEDYYILETILTSPDPSVEEFDKDGNPIYSQETRSKQDIDCFMNIQEGIIEYVKDYMNICPSSAREINKSLDEGLMRLVHHFQTKNTRFSELKVEDPFFNRSTNLVDVI